MPDGTEATNDGLPGLSLAENERLALLAEEMGEALQIIGKIFRHGYDGTNPLGDDTTNREMLEKELGDVRFAMIFLCEAGDTRKAAIHGHADNKRKSVREWLHYND